MSYIEAFPYITFIWGVIALFCVRFGETKPKQYNGLAILLLVLSWGYLLACVPLFRDGHFIPEHMQSFVGLVAALLSIEVWFIFIGAMLGVGLAKTAHDPEHKSYLTTWHSPIRQLIKPAWQVIAIANMANALYYFSTNG